MHTFSDFGVEYQFVTLKNKSKIHLLGKKGAPIHIQACVRAGTRYNTIPGQAHFLEHMLVAGTRSYPSKLALATAIEKVGGYFEAVTDADFLRLTVSVPHKKYVSLAVKILNEMMTVSLYQEAVFKNEQTVVLREQKDRLHNSQMLLMDTLMEGVYSDFELRFQGLGTPESISNMQVKSVTKFASTNITAERTSYIVSGDIEMNEIENFLSVITLPEGFGDTLPELLTPINEDRVTYKKYDGGNSNILIGFRCDTDSWADVVGLHLIQQMFMGRGSRLIQELRYTRGLVYGGGVPFWDFNKTSVFGFRTASATEKLTEVFDIILDILEEISLKGISESECEDLKVKIDSHYRFNLQTAKEWINAEVSALRHDVEGEEAKNALALLIYTKQMTADELTEIYRKYINTKSAHCVVLGSLSEETLEYFHKLL